MITTSSSSLGAPELRPKITQLRGMLETFLRREALKQWREYKVCLLRVMRR
jgi:hypothetical protein